MKKRVLVFPCGSVPGIDINFALRNCLRVEVYGASSIDDHGKYIYKNYIGGLPNIAENNFIEEFNKILREHNIDFIIPTHDTVALFLVENQNRIISKVISTDYETSKICRYKSLTYEKFSDYDFIPHFYKSIDEVQEFPVFLKPDDGQGSNGIYKASNKEELIFYLNNNPNLIICEYLPGDEVTVDCFTDRKSALRFISPRTRTRTLAGISVNSKTFKLNKEILKIASILNSNLNLRGYWFFQLKKDKHNNYKLMEICTRLAGTACLNRNLDVNFPLLSILDFSNEDVDISPNKYAIEVDRTFINRYILNIEYDRVYIDFDDTLVFNRKYYNQYMFMFLYQCVNEGKEIILITKHEYVIKETLDNLKIPYDIFDEIIEINSENYKYIYMNNEKSSIFIDNSFIERKLVRENLGISSFDVSNVECLIDWKG